LGKTCQVLSRGRGSGSAPNHSGAHTNGETVSWLVLEAGAWTLPGGVQLAVGRVSTAATVGRLLTNQWQAVTFSDPFPATPVVLSQVQTNNDPHWVGTRQRAVSTSEVAPEQVKVSGEVDGITVSGGDRGAGR
jgi:serine protease AprX